jgi:DedD protein
MDQILKQRLVGVVVITALAAIFVPMLFDNPVEDNSRMIRELTIPEMPSANFESSIKRLPSSTEQVIKLPPPEPMLIEPENQPIEKSIVVPEKKTKRSEGQKNNSDKMVRWVIQVGSFSQKANAVALKNTLRKQGFSTFVETFETEAGEMFRLKVGPELDKKRAEAMQKKINEKNNLHSILVTE